VLAAQGSYTAAAARLGVSKAAMSQRIAELERVAGVALVQRTTRSVRFTEAGLRLVEGTRAEFDSIAASFASVREMAEVPRGTVRVTAPVAFSRQQLVPRLAHFLRENPEVRVQLELSDRLTSIASEGFDLAIRHTQAPPETHVAWQLCPSRSLLVASPDYLRRHGAPKHPSELAERDCLLYLRDTAGQSWTFERGSGRRAERVVVAVDGPLRANNSEVLREAVLGGLGIGLLPDFSAAAHLGPRPSARPLPEWRPLGFFGDGIYAIRPWAPQVPRAVQCFVDHLKALFAKGFPIA
jgi:DNA-binding transcriptional LysR family regulator